MKLQPKGQPIELAKQPIVITPAEIKRSVQAAPNWLKRYLLAKGR